MIDSNHTDICLLAVLGQACEAIERKATHWIAERLIIAEETAIHYAERAERRRDAVRANHNTQSEDASA